MTDGGLGPYYDRLRTWTWFARPLGYGGGSAQLTVHRLLSDPQAGGRPTATRVHDLIAASIPKLERPRLLDAGCGLGGTLIDLAARLEGTGIGLTLSREQQMVATKAIAASGLGGRLDVRVQSYDTPPPGPFDLIVAIESLAHSADPGKSVTALTGVLASGGILVVVDDMPEAEAVGSSALRTFKDGWQAPVVWSAADYLSAFAHLGLSVVSEQDLTPGFSPRTITQIARMERINRAAHALSPARWRVVLDSYYGGLALERLYRQGLMCYRLMVVQRP
jgi:cyclopropane fatty-acyl-phospholipid synthase-like methyltransferase